MVVVQVDISPPNLQTNRSLYRQYSIALPGNRFYFKGKTAAKRAAGKLSKQLTAILFEFTELLKELNGHYFDLVFYIPVGQHKYYWDLVNETNQNLQLLFSFYGQKNSYNTVMILKKAIINGGYAAGKYAVFCELKKQHAQKKRLQILCSRFEVLSVRINNLRIG